MDENSNVQTAVLKAKKLQANDTSWSWERDLKIVVMNVLELLEVLSPRG